MKRFFFILSWTLFFASTINAQDLKAFKIVDRNGQAVSFEALIDSLAKQDFVFFGELHNNPIAHWLSLETVKALNGKRSAFKVGMEMFETDNQLLVNEYFEDFITKKSFLKEVKLWNNYNTDYAPILDYAKSDSIPFLATNIPRRYANMVFRNGAESLEGLSEEARTYIAPLPIPFDTTLNCYKEMLDMMGNHGGEDRFNFPMAQAVKDATMAHSLAKHWTTGDLIFHLNGSFHSKNKEGIVWYLKRYLSPNIKVSNIAVIEVDDIEVVDQLLLQTADFTILSPSSMTKTY